MSGRWLWGWEYITAGLGWTSVLLASNTVESYYRNYSGREVGLENSLCSSRQGLCESQEESHSNRDTRRKFSSVNKTFTLLNTHIPILASSGYRAVPPSQRWCQSCKPEWEARCRGFNNQTASTATLSCLWVPNPCCKLAMLQVWRHWRSPRAEPADSGMGQANEAVQLSRTAEAQTQFLCFWAGLLLNYWLAD